MRADGKLLASMPELGKLTVKLPATKLIPIDENPTMNYAVNNDGDYYPSYKASAVSPKSSLAKIGDGQYVYDINPSKRWTTSGSTNDKDWVEVDFGTQRLIDTVKLYVIDDRGEAGSDVCAPAKIEIGYWNGSAWKPVPKLEASANPPEGNKPHTLSFPALKTSRLRATLTHAKDGRSGLSEFEAWGPGVIHYVPAPPPAGNIAFNRDGEGFPRITASHSDQFGGIPVRAIDGKIIFEATPMNRWTSYGSPNKQDSLEIEFENKVEIGRVVLHIYDDRGGVQAPANYSIEGWTGSEWKKIPDQVKAPSTPTGNMANVVTFPPVHAAKVRVIFTHAGDARSGVTELEVWKK